MPGSAAICRRKIASRSQGDGICGEHLEIREMTCIWEQIYDLMSNQTRQGLGKGCISVRFLMSQIVTEITQGHPKAFMSKSSIFSKRKEFQSILMYPNLERPTVMSSTLLPAIQLLVVGIRVACDGIQQASMILTAANSAAVWIGTGSLCNYQPTSRNRLQL